MMPHTAVGEPVGGRNRGCRGDFRLPPPGVRGFTTEYLGRDIIAVRVELATIADDDTCSSVKHFARQLAHMS